MGCSAPPPPGPLVAVACWLLSVAADVRSPDDVIALEGRPTAYRLLGLIRRVRNQLPCSSRQCLVIRNPLPTEHLLEDTDGLLRHPPPPPLLKGGRGGHEASTPSTTSRCGSLLLSLSVDVRLLMNSSHRFRRPSYSGFIPAFSRLEHWRAIFRTRSERLPS